MKTLINIKYESIIGNALRRWNRSNKSPFVKEDGHFVFKNFMTCLMTEFQMKCALLQLECSKHSFSEMMVSSIDV